MDADVACPATLWLGVHQYGTAFLRSWRYTQDNWLFTLVAPWFAIMSVVGPRPWLALVSGWSIFVGSVALAAMIARRAGGSAAAWMVAPVLLLASRRALWGVGYLAHPVSHNVSLLWGLATLLIALDWLRARRWSRLVLFGAALLANRISDPWAAAAFLVPLLLASLLLAALAEAADRRALGALALVAGLAEVLAQNQMFGSLSFLPASSYVAASPAAMAANLPWLVRVSTVLFELAPVPKGAAIRFATDVVTCLLVGLVTAGALVGLMRRFRGADLEQRFVVAVAALSCAVMIASFVAGTFPVGMYMGRFLMNVFVLVPLLVSLALTVAADQMPRGARLGAIACGVLMMANGLAGNVLAWRAVLPRASADAVGGLVVFLEEHGLRYGYGPYWGAQANAVTWLGGGRVVVRPVSFDDATGRIAPRGPQASPLWYEPGDVPTGIAETFVVVATDSEHCAEIERCLAGVRAQLGRPDRELAHRSARVLVWKGDPATTVLPHLDR